MDNDVMFVEERKLKILEYLKDRKKATVNELCAAFNVSGATIRNDLRELENSNLLVRAHGGAMVKSKTAYELDAKQREVQNLLQKKRIANAAIQRIEDGDTIILDTGTTTLELARLLNTKRNLTVITNDIEIASVLEDFDQINIILIGGILRKRFHCTIGMAGHEMLAGLAVDKAFMGANGFTVEKGATTPDISQAERKKAMISIASQIILLCDSSKIGRNSFAQFAPLNEIDVLITDELGESEWKQIEEAGIKVLIGK
ncbi:MAG: DeoR/GlpR family DNA-binding transcription regulator [Spirochaetota bacterium]